MHVLFYPAIRALLASALLGVAPSGDSDDEIVVIKTPTKQHIDSILTDLKWRYTFDAKTSTYTVNLDGTRALLSIEGEYILIGAAFRDYKTATLERMNAWNMSIGFGRAYVSEKIAAVEVKLSTTKGVTKAHLSHEINAAMIMVMIFHLYLEEKVALSQIQQRIDEIYKKRK